MGDPLKDMYEKALNDPSVQGVVWLKPRRYALRIHQQAMLVKELSRGATCFYYGKDPAKELPILMNELRENFGVDATYELAPKPKRIYVEDMPQYSTQDIYIIKLK